MTDEDKKESAQKDFKESFDAVIKPVVEWLNLKPDNALHGLLFATLTSNCLKGQAHTILMRPSKGTDFNCQVILDSSNINSM